jgi:hypothetical protein
MESQAPVTCTELFACPQSLISADVIIARNPDVIARQPECILGIELFSTTALVKTLQEFIGKPEQECKLEQERNHRIVCNFSIAITCVAFLLSNKAAGSRVPNPQNPICQRVHFPPLRECDSGKLCAEPVGAPPGTRFFAYDLQPGVVLCPDTGNVTVPASALDSKHGRAPFHVFAESPDEFGAPGYVQSVEVRHEELLVQPDSIAQTVSKAAATALGVSAGYVLYWLVTQHD